MDDLEPQPARQRHEWRAPDAQQLHRHPAAQEVPRKYRWISEPASPWKISAGRSRVTVSAGWELGPVPDRSVPARSARSAVTALS